MPRAFLTGISGFLGRHLAPLLAQRGFAVTGLTRSRPSDLSDQTAGITLVQGDLLADGPWPDALDGADIVIHAAAATGKASPRTHVRVNVDGTAALLREAARRGVGRVVFVSSIAVTFRHLARYHYAQAKRRAEALIRQSALDTVIVRPTIIVGPASPVLEGLRKLAGLPIIPIFGDGTPKVQPMFVDDAAHAIAIIAEDPTPASRTIAIGGPDVVSIEDFVVAIARRLRRVRPRTIHIPLSIVLPLLAVGESIAYGAMPVTVGQLATFRCDGTAGPEGQRFLAGPAIGVEEMLERSL